MAFEHESLVGHLYIVGGRAISTPPPGALCEIAPQKSARSREMETVFTLVLPTGDAIAPTAFYENMARFAAERYFSTTGSVTAGLRESFNAINQNLIEYNRTAKRPYEANMVCGVLRGSDFIVGRVGSAVIAIRHEGQTKTFPEDLSDDEVLYTAPLGVQPIPNVKLTQYRVSTGTRVVFGDSSLADFDTEKINNALMSVDIGTVLVGFKELAKLQMQLMVAEFVPPDGESNPLIPEVQSSADLHKSKTGTKRATQEVSIATATSTSSPSENTTTTPQPTPKPVRERRKSQNMAGKWIKRALGRIALSFSGLFRLFGLMIDRLFGTSPTGESRWFSRPIITGTVVLLPIIIVTVIVVLWLAETDVTEYEQCFTEASSRYDLARSPEIVQSNRQTILLAWEQVLDQVAECQQLRADDPLLDGMKLEGQSVLDTFNQVVRKEPIIITTLPQARITRMAHQGQEVYALDSANGRVYQIVLSNDGLSTTRQPIPIPEMRRGGTASNIQVGDIFDVAFSIETNRLIAIDSNGVLIECEMRFVQCTAQRLLGSENWGNPISVATWSGRLYILDTGNNSAQIWRYEPSGGVFASPPSEYFGGGSRPTLPGALDLEIDSQGSIYVLQSDGVIIKYREGALQNFGFGAFPVGQEIASANGMFLDSNVTSQSLYIATQGQHRVYQTSLSGNFNSSYSLRDESLLDLLEAVVVKPGSGGGDLIYLGSGNTIFVIAKGD
jgi:outer membrane protein assembly factor BamB